MNAKDEKRMAVPELMTCIHMNSAVLGVLARQRHLMSDAWYISRFKHFWH